MVGIDEHVPLLDGRSVPYVNLDNAATTPALQSVLDAVTDLLPRYASVHRGTGYKSRYTTEAYERARRVVGRFVGADPDRDTVVFGKHTTDAINTLAQAVVLPDDAVVITTVLEHHSNDLPWRKRARVLHVRAASDGTLDEDHLDELLAAHAGRIGMVCVTGASNVTGVVPRIHTIAERVHAAGGLVMVDAAQLAAHRPIDLRPHDDPGHLDFVALSGHKVYAPFGAGALIGRRDAFRPVPHHPGGGTIEAVTLADVRWAELPDREEGGSPNVLGAVALAAAVERLQAVGLERVADHERCLVRHITARLRTLPGVHLHAPDVEAVDRVGVVPFTVDGIEHGRLAAVVGHEHGIGIRSGCFCAHPYVAHLLGLSTADVLGAPPGRLGAARVSVAAYTDQADIDRLVHALTAVCGGEIRGEYRQEAAGDWVPRRPIADPIAQPLAIDGLDHECRWP